MWKKKNNIDNKNIDNKNIDNKNIDNKNIDYKNINKFIDTETEALKPLPKEKLNVGFGDEEIEKIKQLLISKKLSQRTEMLFLGTSERIVGSLTTSGDLYLCGQIDGKFIEVKKDFFIHSSGNVLGNIKADRVLTGGSIQGNIEIGQVTCFLDSSSTVGNVLTKKIIVNNGAQFKGTIEINERIKSNHAEKKVSSCFNIDFAEHHKQVANYELNIIGESTVIDGDIHCQEKHLLCLGKVNGKINAPDKIVFIGLGGEVNGAINCKRLHVLGKVSGSVEVSGFASCGANSVVAANVIAKALMLQEGANYEGQVNLGGTTTIAIEKKQEKKEAKKEAKKETQEHGVESSNNL